MFVNKFLIDELQERRSWSAQHGQYLPEVLCPFINVSLECMCNIVAALTKTRFRNTGSTFRTTS
jgi:hypothetical protein